MNKFIQTGLMLLMTSCSGTMLDTTVIQELYQKRVTPSDANSATIEDFKVSDEVKLKNELMVDPITNVKMRYQVAAKIIAKEDCRLRKSKVHSSSKVVWGKAFPDGPDFEVFECFTDAGFKKLIAERESYLKTRIGTPKMGVCPEYSMACTPPSYAQSDLEVELKEFEGNLTKEFSISVKKGDLIAQKLQKIVVISGIEGEKSKNWTIKTIMDAQ